MAYTLSSSTFSISSPVVIKNGNEGYGKILTTDSSGLVQWKEPNSFFGQSRYIGELYGGGIVVDFWKEGDVENTLIMSLKHLSYDYVWSNIETISTDQVNYYQTYANSLYDGKYNSDKITSHIAYNSFNSSIIVESHTMSAAKMCKDYNFAGYEDWYLPSYNEFNSIIKNKNIINRVLGDVDGIRSQNTGTGAALSGLYWTSNEYSEVLGVFPSQTSTYYGIQYSTSEGKFKAVGKTSSAMVRAVRREENITGNGLVLSLDAGNKSSYDDSTKGNIWYDLVNKGVTASAGLTFSASATGVTYSATNSGYFTFQNNTNSYIDFKANLDNSSIVTVEMFARLKSGTSGNVFRWGNGNYGLLKSTNSMGFNTNSGDFYGIPAQLGSDYEITDNWKHFIFVMRSDVSYVNNKIYINGDKVKLSAIFSNPENAISRNFANGAGVINPPGGGYTDGVGMDLAVFNIYKRELNQTEIINNFNKYKKRFEVKDTPYQKDIILNVNSNNINSFDPINLTVWNDTKFTSDTRTLTPLTFASTTTYTKSSGLYPGTSINFDGSNRASVASTITFTYSTTWESWVKFDTGQPDSNFDMFMGQFLPYFAIRPNNSNKIVFSNNYSGIVGSALSQSYQFSNNSIVYDKWYHIVFTTKYDSVSNTTSSKIYINGLPDYGNTITTNGPENPIYDSNSIPGYQLNNYSDYKFSVGDGRDTTWYPFKGSLAEVRIYNRTLSSVEIENNYNTSKHLYDIDQNHYTHNLNTSPTFSIFQNLTLNFPTKENNSILLSDNKGKVSLIKPTSLILGKSYKKSVGDLYAGGIIVSVVDYLSTTNYLISSLEDLPSTYYWSTLAGSQSNILSGLNSDSEFDGSKNTGLIKNALGTGSYASMTASTYNYGGYTDWYLPSTQELREAYNNSNIINLVLGKNSLIDTYWSSSESGFLVDVNPSFITDLRAINSYAFNFGSITSNLSGTPYGIEYLVNKYTKLKVRPFRTEVDSNSTSFITVWKTNNAGSSLSNQIRIPTNNLYTYNYNVDWGDGTTSTGLTTATTKTYVTAGTYTVKITGIFPHIYFYGGGDKLKLLQVKNWGSIKWSSFNSSFTGCSNLTITATDAPDLSNVTDMSAIFQDCTSFNQSIDHWNVSTIDNLILAFYNCSSFNQPLNSWNVSAVTNMQAMFQSASVFNQPLNSWNTSAVINMSAMFAYASVFNQPLTTNVNKWNVSAVTNMDSMFQSALAFNQPLNSWDTISVVSMISMFADTNSFNNGLSYGVSGALNWNTLSLKTSSNMFQHAPAFNQSLTTSGNIWNMSLVTDTSFMFYNTSSFNQSLNSWNTSSVTNMSGMFEYAYQFNNGLAAGVSGPLNFDTHLVTNMSYMFKSASYFNQSLTTSGNIWNVSNVQNMNAMFRFALYFNQPLSTWNVSSVTNMYQMFQQSNAFNQNIGSWNISNVTDFTDFMSTKTPTTLSTANLNAIYIGWSSLPTVKPNIIITFGTAKYTNTATTARGILISAPRSWVITDGGI